MKTPSMNSNDVKHTIFSSILLYLYSDYLNDESRPNFKYLFDSKPIHKE